MKMKMDIVVPAEEPGRDEDRGDEGLYETAPLMAQFSAEISELRKLLSGVERAICDVIDENAVAMDGEVAATLQQLDLSIQTAGCLAEVMSAAAAATTDGGHQIGETLERLSLRDLAKRLAV